MAKFKPGQGLVHIEGGQTVSHDRSSVEAVVQHYFDALYEAFSEGRLVSDSSTPGVDFTRLAAKIAGVPETKKKRFSLFG